MMKTISITIFGGYFKSLFVKEMKHSSIYTSRNKYCLKLRVKYKRLNFLSKFYPPTLIPFRLSIAGLVTAKPYQSERQLAVGPKWKISDAGVGRI